MGLLSGKIADAVVDDEIMLPGPLDRNDGDGAVGSDGVAKAN